MEKSIRCTVCAAEFTEEEITGATSCPSCGTKGVPCSIEQDLDLRINWHELRILCIWASNYAQSLGDEHKLSLNAIIGRLEPQRKEGWPALTLLGEIRELSEQLEKEGYDCTDVDLYDEQGNKIMPPKKKLKLINSD